jgi:RHS repeat-associated protein
MNLARRCHRSLLTVFKALIVGLCIVTHVAAQTSTVTYFHNDLAGSAVAASDSSGAIIWRESYRPYGERLTNASASQDNSQWYTGHRQDAESGLVYMGARHYDPLIGRFLSIDPAPFTEGNPHSFNRYAYANNNPVKFVDPDGKAALLGYVLVGTALLFVGYSLLPQRNKDRLQEALTFSPSISMGPSQSSSDNTKSSNGGSGSLSSSASGASPPPDDDDSKPTRVTNPKHHENSKSPEPKNVGKLYEDSVADSSGVRWAQDADGVVHRFSRPSNGQTHWNGSTGGARPIELQNIPGEIKNIFNIKG